MNYSKHIVILHSSGDETATNKKCEIMPYNHSLIIVISVILSACATSTKTATNASVKSVESVYWVNGKKTDCVNPNQKGCLEIQKGEYKNPQNWQAFAEPIEGFSYEKGYVYKLLINEEQRLNNTPTDTFDKKYKLIRVIEKTFEPKLLLNQRWVLEKILAKPLVLDIMPTIEFNLDLKRMSSSDGCNIFVSEIKSVVYNHIFWGNVIGTKKYCEDMKVATEYSSQLGKIYAYKTENQTLTLSDRECNEILSFISS